MSKKLQMRSLSTMSGIQSPAEPTESEVTANAPVEQPPQEQANPKAKAKRKKKQEKLVTVNIKIGKSQKDWLTNTASAVRDNNTDPVPPSDRVYPQHLIGVAIDLLKSSDVNWEEILNVEDLRERLKL